jgi:hypothetical protein
VPWAAPRSTEARAQHNPAKPEKIREFSRDGVFSAKKLLSPAPSKLSFAASSGLACGHAPRNSGIVTAKAWSSMKSPFLSSPAMILRRLSHKLWLRVTLFALLSVGTAALPS